MGLPEDTWTTYSVPMTASAWGVTEDEWVAILSEVVMLRISAEALWGAEVQGFDNVTLTCP